MGGNCCCGDTSGSQPFLLIFTVIHHFNHSVLIICYSFNTYLLSTCAVSSSMLSTGTAGDSRTPFFKKVGLFYPLYFFPSLEELVSKLSPNRARGFPTITVCLYTWCSSSPTFLKGGCRVFRGTGEERMSRRALLSYDVKNVIKERSALTHTGVGIR